MLADVAPYVAFAALAAAAALAGVAFWFARRLRDLGTRQSAVLGPRERRDVVAFVLELEQQVENLREAVTVLTEEVEYYRHDLDASLSNIAVVRFDAFPDTGGEQSASIALLDNYRSGVVISIIASRETARLYVKFLDHGVPDRRLAPEEQAAVERAVPKPLARGELSRSPVSTFSREVRRAIEEAARRSARAEPAAAPDAAAAAGEGAAGEATAEALAAATPEEEGAAGDERPGMVGRPGPAAPGDAVPEAATADAGAASAVEETWSWEAPAETPDLPAPAADEEADDGQCASGLTRTTPGTGTADDAETPASQMICGLETSVGDGSQATAEEAPASGAPGTRARRHDDWLGGDELDF